MGFINDKDDVEKDIGIFKTISALPKDPKKNSSLRSVKSSAKNILPYLMEMLSVSCDEPNENENEIEENLEEQKQPLFSGPPPKGALLKATGGNPGKCNAIRILIEILIEFLPELIRIVKEAIAVAIREALSCSSDFKLPPNTVQIIDIDTIDYNGILKSNPDSNILGGIFFGDSEKDFNRFLYNTIQTPLTTTTWEGPNGPMMDITFIPPGQLSIALNQNYVDKNFNDFISDYMNSIELFNQKILLGSTIDYFFSNITPNLNVSYEQIVNEEKTNKLLDKILDKDPCEDDIVYDNSFFDFDNKDLEELEKKAKERKDGIVAIDLGCGIYDFELSTDPNNGIVLGLLDRLDADAGDPIKQGKNVENLLEKMGDIAGSTSPKDKETIKQKMNTDFTLQLPKVIAKCSILTPKILVIYNFSNFIVNNVTITERNSYDWAKSNRVFFEYVGRESLAVLVRIVFNRLKAELMRLIARVIKKIIENITKKKLKIIASFALPAVGAVISGLISKIPTPELAGSQYK